MGSGSQGFAVTVNPAIGISPASLPAGGSRPKRIPPQRLDANQWHHLPYGGFFAKWHFTHRYYFQWWFL